MPRISVRIFVRRVAILYCNFSVSIFIESPRNTLTVSYHFFWRISQFVFAGLHFCLLSSPGPFVNSPQPSAAFSLRPGGLTWLTQGSSSSRSRCFPLQNTGPAPQLRSCQSHGPRCGNVGSTGKPQSNRVLFLTWWKRSQRETQHITSTCICITCTLYSIYIYIACI